MGDTEISEEYPQSMIFDPSMLEGPLSPLERFRIYMNGGNNAQK
jgi:hypothetical protein